MSIDIAKQYKIRDASQIAQIYFGTMGFWTLHYNHPQEVSISKAKEYLDKNAYGEPIYDNVSQFHNASARFGIDNQCIK